MLKLRASFRKAVAAALVLIASSGAVLAQSNPGLVTGQIPTAVQWNGYFGAKQDYSAALASLSVAGTTGSGGVVLATSPTITTPTLISPSISTIVNTGTLTLPTSTDTLVGRATTDTLTNKTIAFASNTLTGVAPLASPTFTGTITANGLMKDEFSTGLVAPISKFGSSDQNRGVWVGINGGGNPWIQPYRPSDGDTSNYTLYLGNASASSPIVVNGILGVGMVPSNILDIAGNQNSAVVGQITNNSGTAGAYATFKASNNTGNSMFIASLSNGYTTSGVLTPNAGLLQSTSNLAILSGGVIQFATNNSTTESLRITTSGRILGNGSSGAILGLGTVNANGAVVNIDSGVNAFYPVTDNVTSLGYSGLRWTTVFAANGTINTSDERFKRWDIPQRNYRQGIRDLWVGDVTMWDDMAKTKNPHHVLAIRAQQAYKVLGGVGVDKPKNPKDPWGEKSAEMTSLALWGVKDLYKLHDEDANRIQKLEHEVANDNERRRLDPYAHAFCLGPLCVGWK